MLRFVILLMGFLAAAPAAAQKGDRLISATGTRLGGDAERTRLVVDLSAAVEPRIFTLADPYRVIVDLPDVVFGTEPLAHQARGLISAYRYGLIAPKRSRIVIDVTQPVRIEDVHTVPPAQGQPTRLVIDLVPSSREAFLANLQAEAPGVEQVPRPAVPAAPDASDTRPVVVIDPGHGGLDTGAKGASGEEEKNIVLGFAHALNKLLLTSGRYQVLMTRVDDNFIALPDRVKIARDAGADLFISVHADSVADPFGVRGATVYTLSENASDADAARLAEKENRADILAGVDLAAATDEVADILIDLARRETKVFSVRFATTLVGSVKRAMRMNKNPIRSASFVVLKAPDVPSVLLELGYMTSKDDLKLLMSASWREEVAEAMVRAIDGYFASQAAGGSPSGVN